MYSILIQNQSTMESFHEYHPLFMEAIVDKKIGVCRWIESGTSIDTALPELCELTADKEHWRAIIVRVVDEVEMQQAKADSNNPYDFDAYKDGQEVMEESSVPLIRLTHILGGVPAPLVEFKEENQVKENQVAQVVYKPVRNTEKEEAHRALEKKYQFDGKRPAEIVMVTFHKRGHVTESSKVQFSWTNFLEVDSSEFWRRNQYPSSCRFLKYDYDERGPVQRNADLFNFWMSVMLLAENTINSSSLQGYRLYNIKTDFDKEKMAHAFQVKVDTLVGTKNYIGLEIKRDQEEKASIDEMAVVDFANVDGLEVNVTAPRDTVLRVSENEFNLCGRTTNEDYAKWEGMKGVVESNLDSLYKYAERDLEKCTDRMRLKQHMEDEDVKPINHFQEEDIQTQLDGLYIEILNGQSELSGLTRRNQEKLDEKAKAVEEHIIPRIIKGCASNILLLVALVVAACCIPCIFFRKVEIMPTILPSVLLTLGMLAVYALITYVVLKVQHHHFMDKVDEYNEEVDRAKEDLEHCTRNLTDFVRSVVAYSRGSDYLNLLAYKRFSIGYTYDALQRHMKATNLFLDKLRKWSRAYYIDTNFNPQTQDNFRIDIDLSPQHNFLYTFESGKSYAVPLNETGEVVYSPFEFVVKLNIDREELFDHAGTDEEDLDSGCNYAGADGSTDCNKCKKER